MNGEIIQRFELPRGSMGVNGVSISADNQYVVAVDKSTYHEVHMFSMATGRSVRNWPQKGDTNVTYDISFSLRQGDYRFCTTGVRHVYFWDNNGKKKGTTPGNLSHCVNCWDELGNAYTGGKDGCLYYWANGAAAKKISAHKSFMTAIRHADGRRLFTGAADGIKIWSTEGGMPKLQNTINDFGGSQVRAIDAMNGQLLVGTKAGTIY